MSDDKPILIYTKIRKGQLYNTWKRIGFYILHYLSLDRQITVAHPLRPFLNFYFTIAEYKKVR